MDVFDKRDNFIGKKFTDKDYCHGIRRYDGLNLHDIEELQKIGVVRNEERQNDSPTVGEIVNFLKQFKDKNITCHGYVEGRERNSLWIIIEGVEYKGAIDSKLQAEFSKLFRNADSFELTDKGFYCWYD